MGARVWVDGRAWFLGDYVDVLDDEGGDIVAGQLRSVYLTLDGEVRLMVDDGFGGVRTRLLPTQVFKHNSDIVEQAAACISAILERK